MVFSFYTSPAHGPIGQETVSKIPCLPCELTGHPPKLSLSRQFSVMYPPWLCTYLVGSCAAGHESEKAACASVTGCLWPLSILEERGTATRAGCNIILLAETKRTVRPLLLSPQSASRGDRVGSPACVQVGRTWCGRRTVLLGNQGCPGAESKPASGQRAALLVCKSTRVQVGTAVT
jgi:hypothetical protein